ncbi:MAG: YqgE/AlgH family protein [Gammaproteobacteria bacterium]|nr:YqgE/AlgH family protein [Gammaproteobacteria bacterium]
MLESGYLTNHFLIAMPALADPNFFRTVTYICEHNSDGAMGIVINRPLDIRLGEILRQVNIEGGDDEIANEPVCMGGPVQYERIFILHQPLLHWESTLPITDTLGLSTSRDILTAIARREFPGQALVALGYAGWGPGQLEEELAQNAWLNGQAQGATARILFETPYEKRWSEAAALLGVDISNLSGEVGHA